MTSRLPILPALVLLLCACGGGSSDGDGLGPLNCAPLTPCAGNLVGTWTLRGQCIKDSNACSGASYDYSMSGTTLKFEDGLLTVTGAGSAHSNVPHSCLTDDADGGACNEVTERAGYTCLVGMTTCDCNIDLTRATPTAKPVKYALSGTQFLVGNVTYSFCIFQGVLRIAVDTPGMGDGPVAEYVKR